MRYYKFNTDRVGIFEYIESWYNRKRTHSSIDHLTSQPCEELARTA